MNYLELRVFYLELLALLPHVKDCAVKIMPDNICAVLYTNKLGGTHPPNPNVLPRIRHLGYPYSIQHFTCHPYHWPGCENYNMTGYPDHLVIIIRILV